MIRKCLRNWKSRVLACLGKCLLRLLMRSCHLEIKGLDLFVQFAEKEGCIVMLWHNRVSIATEIFFQSAPHLPYSAIVSKSRDGEILTHLIESYKTGSIIRIPHDSKSQALRNIIQSIKQKKQVVIITPDGPRGPRYRVKPGIVLASEKTASMIVPFSWAASGFWQFKTWDKLMLPKPFSKIQARFGSPISIQGNRKEGTGILENTLCKLDEQIYSEVYKEPSEWPR